VNVPSPGLAGNPSLDREGSSSGRQESGSIMIASRITKASADHPTRASAPISSPRRPTGDVLRPTRRTRAFARMASASFLARNR
jgi:hypothetical protein